MKKSIYSLLFILFVSSMFSCVSLLPGTKITYSITSPGKGNKFIITDSDGEMKRVNVDKSKNIQLRVNDGFVGGIIAYHLNFPNETKIIIHGREKDHIIYFNEVENFLDCIYFYHFDRDTIATIMPPKTDDQKEEKHVDNL